ncbi:MAG: arginine decarboxylase, partial [Bacteroidota bacterium]
MTKYLLPLVLMFFFSSCVAVKEYDKVYLNDD